MYVAHCAHGVDDDGLVDFDDYHCDPARLYYKGPPRCGLGAELALVMGALLRRWRRVRPLAG